MCNGCYWLTFFMLDDYLDFHLKNNCHFVLARSWAFCLAWACTGYCHNECEFTCASIYPVMSKIHCRHDGMQEYRTQYLKYRSPQYTTEDWSWKLGLTAAVQIKRPYCTTHHQPGKRWKLKIWTLISIGHVSLSHNHKIKKSYVKSL